MSGKHSKAMGLIVCGTILVGGAAAWLSGCGASVTPGPGGGVTFAFTIAGQTFSFTLGGAGVFSVQPGTMVRNVADLQPFDRAPTDSPATGAVRLRSSSVSVLPSDGKWLTAAQASLNGTATLRVAIDAAGAANPCETGLELGTFEIVVQDGVVTATGPGLAMSLAAVDYFHRNDLTLCLEAQADFDATLQISDLDITFGPSQSGVGDGLRATFERRNLETPPIHILAPGEGFTDENRVGIGAPRNSIVDGLDINGLVTFRAGRDGEELDSVICPPVRYSGYIGIVEWDGTNLRCYEPASEPPSTTEACCMPSLPGYESYDQTFAESARCYDIGVTTSAVRTAEDCRFFGGIPQGAGTSCASLTCNEPFGACCWGPEGRYCSDLLAEDCSRDEPGTFQGVGVYCESRPCGEGPDNTNDNSAKPDQACCFDDGTCDDGDPEVCAISSGAPQGAGSTCATASCPQPDRPGACCQYLTDQCFDNLTETECRDGFGGFLGGGTTCATSDCTVGACCEGPDVCNHIWKDFCNQHGGEWQGARADGIDCLYRPCQGGACCWSGGCTETTPLECGDLGGEWIGGRCSEPDPCAEADFVVWYTRSVCCWGAPLLYITDRAGFERVEYQCNFPGGGTDCTAVTVKAELMGGFESYEAAQAWICPQFVSYFSHAWCSQYYQMDGANWQPGALGCDLSGLPPATTVPDVNGCQ